jgi:hypothetical protein
MGHMYIYNLLLRMADTVTSQNIDLSSWDTQFIYEIRTYIHALGGFLTHDHSY